MSIHGFEHTKNGNGSFIHDILKSIFRIYLNKFKFFNTTLFMITSMNNKHKNYDKIP